jgi:hypothetical protein
MVEAERIPDSKEMCRRGIIQAESKVKIHLMDGGDLVRSAEMQDLLRLATLKVIAGVLHEYVPRLRQLPFQVERWFPKAIAAASLSLPEKALLSPH